MDGASVGGKSGFSLLNVNGGDSVMTLGLVNNRMANANNRQGLRLEKQ